MSAIIPTTSGAYRWYYFDVTAGDFTAVFIFMIGSLFSPRYVRSARRGAQPLAHAAINFALYEKGQPRQWVLSEYPLLSLEDGARTLRIGGSRLRWNDDGTMSASVAERTPWLGKPVRAELHFTPEVRGTDAYQLVNGLSHYWQPFAPRGSAKVSLSYRDLTLEGRGYHDGNHGEVPLGTDLRGWDWERTHHRDFTRITYRPWQDETTPLVVSASAGALIATRAHLPPAMTVTTGWGLPVPAREPMALLESSPFYARLEHREEHAETMGEVADFQRFRTPPFTWMASFRTRVERDS